MGIKEFTEIAPYLLVEQSLFLIGVVVLDKLIDKYTSERDTSKLEKQDSKYSLLEKTLFK